MIIEFKGTRGGIEEFSKKHKYHSSLLIKENQFKLLIDYGEEHKDELKKIRPNWILITHAHPDHAFGLKEQEINVPVYLTKFSYDYIKNFPVKNFNVINVNKEFNLGLFKVRAYDVLHSLRCPAVCYKIRSKEKVIVYAPDLIDINDKKDALKNVDLYIGDGASLFRSIVRRRGSKLFGHCSIKTQVNWCKKFGIKQMIITHCGKEIVEMQEDKLKNKLKEYSEGKLEIIVAYDGMRVIL